MDSFEEKVAKSFTLVKKDINKLYSIVEELRLKVEAKEIKKAVGKKGIKKKK